MTYRVKPFGFGVFWKIPPFGRDAQSRGKHCFCYMQNYDFPISYEHLDQREGSSKPL